MNESIAQACRAIHTHYTMANELRLMALRRLRNGDSAMHAEYMMRSDKLLAMAEAAKKDLSFLEYVQAIEENYLD